MDKLTLIEIICGILLVYFLVSLYIDLTTHYNDDELCKMEGYDFSLDFRSAGGIKLNYIFLTQDIIYYCCDYEMDDCKWIRRIKK